MKAIIPVAGKGTRLMPLTAKKPKPLLRILNKPILQWSLEGLVEAGISHAMIVIAPGEYGEQVKDFVGQIKPLFKDLQIDFVVQEQPLGTAHVVQVAKDFINAGEEFIFVYGDDLYGVENIKLVVSHDGPCLIGQKVEDPEKWGILSADGEGKFLSVVEKPRQFVGDLANIGCMKLPQRIFSLYEKLTPSPRGEMEITDSLNLLAQELTIKVLPSVDYWLPIGYPQHILIATKTLNPGVLLGENTEVSPDAKLTGSVVIGNHCQIGAGCELENCVIGDYVSLEAGTKLKNTIISDHREDTVVVEI